MGDTQLVTRIRDMLRSDLEDVLTLDHASSHDTTNLGELVYCFNKPSTVGFVADFQDQLIGFLFYQRAKTFLRLLDVVVAPEFRRFGVGTQLINKMLGKLTARRQPKVACLVGEDDLRVQLFMRSCGFLATTVVAAKDRMKKTAEDAYAFEYDLECAPGCGVHR